MNSNVKKFVIFVFLTIPVLYSVIYSQDIINQTKSGEYSFGVFILILLYSFIYITGVGFYIVYFITDFFFSILDTPLTRKLEAKLLKLSTFLKLYKMRSLRGGIAFSFISIFTILSQFMINHNYGVLLIAILVITAILGFFYIGIPIIGSAVIFTSKTIPLLIRGEKHKIKEQFDQEFRIITILRDK